MTVPASASAHLGMIREAGWPGATHFSEVIKISFNFEKFSVRCYVF